MPQITLNTGPELFQFATFTQWVNKGSSWYRNCGTPPKRTIAVDAAGRVCNGGRDMDRADDEGTFPVKVYAI